MELGDELLSTVARGRCKPALGYLHMRTRQAGGAR
jgi:hypothetical protein